MNEEIKTIVENYTLDKFQVAIISVIVSVATYFITNWLKNHFEGRLHLRKLRTDHKFEQQKKIKEVLAKNKVHLISACEDLNHRFWNFANNHQKGWLDVQGNYGSESHYFHSFTYRILVVFAWVRKVEKEMIFLDTTIADKEDLEFIKFLKIFPQIFCNLTFLGGINPNTSHARDHFFRNNFETLPDCLFSNDNIQSYSQFVASLPNTLVNLNPLYVFLEGVTPTENRIRWDRLHLFHITLIIFLNNYGYDFQITNEEKMKNVLENPKKTNLLHNYLLFLKEYHIEKNSEVKKLTKIINSL